MTASARSRRDNIALAVYWQSDVENTSGELPVVQHLGVVPPK